MKGSTMEWTDEDEAGYQCFGFVRNPWARLVSLYAHLCGSPEIAAKLSRPEALTDFKVWLFDPTPVHPSQAQCWGDLPPPRQPQSWWLDGCRKVGRFEHFADDFDKIARIIRVRPGWLRQLNISQHPHYRTMYDAEAREAVAEWHADDIARWRYRF